MSGVPTDTGMSKGHGRRTPGGEFVFVGFQAVSESYHRLLGIAIRRGRDIAATDEAGGPRVAVINETLARALFADTDPLGKTLLLGGNELPFEIVGIAADRHNAGLRAPADPEMVASLRQFGSATGALLVRWAGEAARWLGEAARSDGQRGRSAPARGRRHRARRSPASTDPGAAPVRVRHQLFRGARARAVRARRERGDRVGAAAPRARAGLAHGARRIPAAGERAGAGDGRADRRASASCWRRCSRCRLSAGSAASCSTWAPPRSGRYSPWPRWCRWRPGSWPRCGRRAAPRASRRWRRCVTSSEKVRVV